MASWVFSKTTHSDGSLLTFFFDLVQNKHSTRSANEASEAMLIFIGFLLSLEVDRVPQSMVVAFPFPTIVGCELPTSGG